jgi:hypothetical protein
LSNTLDGSFCLEMRDETLSHERPEVFNTDEGVQFTAEAVIGRLESAGVAVSMDGRGRALDNVFVERLWRAVKYEDVSIRGYEQVPELWRGLGRYFAFYNTERLHQSLGYRTPPVVYGASGPRGRDGRAVMDRRILVSDRTEGCPTRTEDVRRLFRRGIGVKLERSCSRPDQPGWDTPDSRGPGRGREQDTPW